MAIISMASSLASIILGFTWIIGIICGHIAMKEIREKGEQGEAFAKTGLIVGYIFGGLAALGVIILIIATLMAVGAASTYSAA